MLCKLSLETKQKNIYVHYVLMSEIFVKLSSFRDKLFQGKQHELVNTKEYSDGTNFDFKTNTF